jgi:AcrR family transcriptional regulator
VREIASAAGVTIPALYYHFTSKDGLLASLVEPLSLDGERVLAELADDRSPHGPDDALAAYYDVVTAHLRVFRLVMVDPAVRSDEVTGRRLAAQGERFLELLTGDSPDRGDLIRAHAALGAIRRPLRIDGVDVLADRPQILASARAALDARPH